jgi:hypothetical protein
MSVEIARVTSVKYRCQIMGQQADESLNDKARQAAGFER